MQQLPLVLRELILDYAWTRCPHCKGRCLKMGPTADLTQPDVLSETAEVGKLRQFAQGTNSRSCIRCGTYMVKCHTCGSSMWFAKVVQFRKIMGELYPREETIYELCPRGYQFQIGPVLPQLWQCRWDGCAKQFKQVAY